MLLERVSLGERQFVCRVEAVFARVRERTESMSTTTKDRAGELVSAARDKVGEVRSGRGGSDEGATG